MSDSQESLSNSKEDNLHDQRTKMQDTIQEWLECLSREDWSEVIENNGSLLSKTALVTGTWVGLFEKRPTFAAFSKDAAVRGECIASGRLK